MNPKGNPQNLKPFKKGVDERRGIRKPSRVDGWLKETLPRKMVKAIQALSSDEVRQIDQFLLCAPMEALKQSLKNENMPMYLKAYAMAIIIDGKNGKTTAIDKLRDRLFGTATQNVNISIASKYDAMTDEELQAEIDLMREQREAEE